MKKATLFLLGFLFLVSLSWGQNAWINEIHYDNFIPSGDLNEGIEVIIESAENFTIANFTVTLYNGSGGATYGSHSLNTFVTGNTIGDFTFYHKMIAGIQNGAPDGLALDYEGTLIQFLSYEGSFIATNGVANGQTSSDIGVMELSPTTDIQSLQLTGTGMQYSDFTWTAGLTQTWGALNSGGDQILPVDLSSFYALYIGGTLTLYWTTQSETDNAYWNVYRGTISSFEEAELLNTNHPIPGNGTTNSASDYVYVDTIPVVQNSTYWYWIEDVSFDGETEVHVPITLFIPFEDSPIAPDTYGLHQNYPNPFNPSTSISFALEAESYVELIIYNVKGEKVKQLVRNQLSIGQHFVVWDGNDAMGKQVSTGVYFYKLITDTKEYQRKMLLVK
ncbi:MAG: T9SS type A sorting domain-containing protein [Candidatus Cloacimonetes bacterium]|nr:T9SS type A sorting domain-containing protein [Candidatus Cloacimonadota bacterium]